VKRSMKSLVAGSLSWLALGCDEPLKSVELIAEPRVLGGRVEVDGDPGRAAPTPGERATASFLLATPELSPSLGFAFAVCPGAARRSSRPACAVAPFAAVFSENGASDTPSIAFEVPDDLDPSGRLVVLGIICPDGAPTGDGASCDGADPGAPIALELELARDDDTNLNPELSPEDLTLDGEVWPELPAGDGDCTGQGLVEVAPGSKHRLGVALDDADRDPLLHPSELDPTRESLQLSHFTTAGELEHAFQSIAWDSEQLAREVSWTAPKAPGLARFWLVVRDFRGGGVFTERAICVR
jgi:hypothetical protein